MPQTAACNTTQVPGGASPAIRGCKAGACLAGEEMPQTAARNAIFALWPASGDLKQPASHVWAVSSCKKLQAAASSDISCKTQCKCMGLGVDILDRQQPESACIRHSSRSLPANQAEPIPCAEATQRQWGKQRLGCSSAGNIWLTNDNPSLTLALPSWQQALCLLRSRTNTANPGTGHMHFCSQFISQKPRGFQGFRAALQLTNHP